MKRDIRNKTEALNKCGLEGGQGDIYCDRFVFRVRIPHLNFGDLGSGNQLTFDLVPFLYTIQFIGT